MKRYSYVKKHTSKFKKTAHYLSYFVMTGGALLLFWAFYPVVAFEIYSRLFMKSTIISPVTQANAAPPAIGSEALSASSYGSNLKDFTQASLWFPHAMDGRTAESSGEQKTVVAKQYELSIPKLNIERARVQVGGDDLSKGLVHYLPATLPGESGNVSIFGHSTLPQLYNTKDYKSIFTYLPQLERGDKIIVHIGGEEYEYEVGEMYVVKPDNITPIEQQYDGSYLTLVTCVPPGTYWNRLIVKAKLRSISADL